MVIMEYSSRQQIFEKIRQDIMDGKYKKGDSLIEQKLAEEFGVSRTPVREAMRQLEFDGLVKSIPNRGVFVNGITHQDIKDIYQIRQRIEGLAAVWAVQKMTEDEMEELQNIYDLMEFYTEKGNINKVAELNTHFHEVIFKAAKSKFLKNTLINFQAYIQWARHASIKIEGRAQAALKEHKAIVEAFRKKDESLAERLIMEHVGNSIKNLEHVKK
jgi:DNA-binding GntR family transcriptional regulator